MVDHLISFISEAHLNSNLDGSLPEETVYSNDNGYFYKSPSGKEKQICRKNDCVMAQISNGRFLYCMPGPKSDSFFSKILRKNEILLFDPEISTGIMSDPACFPADGNTLLYMRSGTMYRLYPDLKEEVVLRTNDGMAQIKKYIAGDKTVVISQNYDKRIVYEAFYTIDGQPLDNSNELSLRHAVSEFIIRSVVDDEKLYSIKYSEKKLSKTERECVSLFDGIVSDDITYDTFTIGVYTFLEGGIAHKRRAENLLRALDILSRIDISEEELPLVIYGLFDHQMIIHDKMIHRLEEIEVNDGFKPEEKKAAVKTLCGLKKKK